MYFIVAERGQHYNNTTNNSTLSFTSMTGKLFWGFFDPQKPGKTS